jgi:hypothetical protein
MVSVPEIPLQRRRRDISVEPTRENNFQLRQERHIPFYKNLSWKTLPPESRLFFLQSNEGQKGWLALEEPRRLSLGQDRAAVAAPVESRGRQHP